MSSITIPAPDRGLVVRAFASSSERWRRAFPDAHFAPEYLVADEDHVCVAYMLSGTHRGPFHDIPATDKRVEARGVQIGRFEHAHIVERWGSTDELGIMWQIGVIPGAG
jgi:predicted ester cyclase